MEQEERIKQVSVKILVNTRNELYMKMRYFDVALSSYPFVLDEEMEGMGTDGLCLYYHPVYLASLFRNDRVGLNRRYLHIMFHGMFRHMVRPRGLDDAYYYLACDIVAESLVDSFTFPCVKQASSWVRKQMYERLKKEMTVPTPLRVYKYLLQLELSGQELLHLVQEFCVDSHAYWPGDDDQEKQQEIENKWRDISEKSQTDMETFSKEEEGASGHLVDTLKIRNRERMDYRSFLRKFAVLREEVKVDPDTFDYVFYTYGLSYYGNMPLIELQEWKEEKRIEDFVIVVDTSMSTSGALVRKFLRQTYQVLSENDSFFRKINIHIIQCDDQIQSDVVITSQEELQQYMDEFTLIGEGGTDFRPAFDYVNKLVKEHAFHGLKGLLYFTDGQGIYPMKRPAYDVAFVFMQEDYEDTKVPPWAMKLILQIDEFQEDSE